MLEIVIIDLSKVFFIGLVLNPFTKVKVSFKFHLGYSNISLFTTFKPKLIDHNYL